MTQHVLFIVTNAAVIGPKNRKTDDQSIGEVLRLVADLLRHSLAEPVASDLKSFVTPKDSCGLLLVER